ncbi:MAG: imidazoleglycerol-phosphate dehydratase HisB [Epulopiscium sp.]|nr:imidazoleglycerol-phosphate dehydratase HisB [Candidatus Epulonipiscium sp.]
MNKRKAKIERKTKETDIQLEIMIDGTGNSCIQTGIGFFDHMLNHLSKHGFMDIYLNAQGDLEVDSHHTIEDIGIVFGQALSKALGNKIGIKRYGSCILPMEDALVLCSIDISGRPYCAIDAVFTVPMIGTMQTEMIEEFFRAVSFYGGINLHIKVLAGKNNHHIAEAMFKAFAKALDEAAQIDTRIKGVLSTKGILET